MAGAVDGTGHAGPVLVVGESLVDVVVRADGSSREHPGGSPMNVAIGLARLGREAHLLTRVGADVRGARVREHLEASGVHLVPGSVVEGATSVAAATLGPDGAATYTFDLLWSLPSEVTGAAGAATGGRLPLAVHTGSIAAVLEPGAAGVRDAVLAHAHRATTSYDPNLRPDVMGSPDAVRARVEQLVAASDVVKLSDEDAAWLEPDTDPEELARRWLALGPSLVVLTRGGSGLVGWCAAGRVEVAAPRVRVADTVGAGDSATAALLDALAERGLLGGPARAALAAISADELRGVLEHAARVAAITVSRPGADPPWRRELEGAPADQQPEGRLR